MRKSTVLFVVLLSFGGVIGACLLVSRGPLVSYAPSVSFTGREPGLPYRAAGFYVKNRRHQAIFLQQVQVQIGADGGWKTISEGQIAVSPVLEAGASNINFSPFLEAGDHRKIVVEWPEDRPWRVCIAYAPERRGLSALTTKAWMAWRNRSMSHWRGRVWGRLDGIDQVISNEISK